MHRLAAGRQRKRGRSLREIEGIYRMCTFLDSAQVVQGKETGRRGPGGGGDVWPSKWNEAGGGRCKSRESGLIGHIAQRGRKQEEEF